MDNNIFMYDDEMSQEGMSILPYSGEEYTYIDDTDFYENMYSPLTHWLPKEKAQNVPTIKVYSGTGLMDWSGKGWEQAFETKYYVNKAKNIKKEPTLPEMGKRNYIAYTPYFGNDGNVKFRPTIAEINDNAIIERGWDGVPIELSYNTSNNELNYTNYFIYQDMMKKQLDKFRKNPMDYEKYSDLVSKLLKKEWLLNDIKSLDDVGYSDDDEDRIAALRKTDNELDNYIISQARAIYRLKRDAQGEYGRRLGKKRMYSIDEIARMPYEYQVEEAKNIIFSAFKTTDDGRYIEASTDQLKDAVKKLDQIRKKSNLLRREDVIEQMSWFSKTFLGKTVNFAENLKEKFREEGSKKHGDIFGTYIVNSLYGLGEKFVSVMNWLPEEVVFDLDHPLEEYITTFEKFIESKGALSGTSGKLKLVNPDYRGIGEKEKNEVQRMKDDFMGGLLSEGIDTITEKGFSIFSISAFTSIGASIGTAFGPVGTAIGGLSGTILGLLVTAAGIGGLQPLKRAGYGIEGYFDNFSNDEVLAVGRLLYRKIDDEEYKKMLAEMPEQKDRIDAMKKLGDMYDNAIFEDYNQVGSAVGSLIGDLATSFRGYKSLLKGKEYVQQALIKMNAAPEIWRHIPYINKLEKVKIAEKALDWAGRLPNERFVIDPNMKPIMKFFKRAAQMTEEGMKTWAIAEMIRNNPYTDFDDIAVAARTGALFNLWSLSVGMGLRRMAGDKWLNKSIEDIENNVNKLLKDVNEKGVKIDQILRDAGRHDIIDLHKKMDDAILDKYILIGDLLIANVAQTASLRLIDGGFDGLTRYFGSSELLSDLLGGVFLGAQIGYGKYKSYTDLKSKYKNVEMHINDAIDRLREDAKYKQLLSDIEAKRKKDEEEKAQKKNEADAKRAKEAQTSIEQKQKDVARETPIENINEQANIFVSDETHAKVEDANKVDVSEPIKEERSELKTEENKEEPAAPKPKFQFVEFNPIDYETYDKNIVDEMNNHIHAESGGDASMKIYDKDLYDENGNVKFDIAEEIVKALKSADEFLANYNGNGEVNTDDVLFYKIDKNKKRVIPVLRNNRTIEFAKRLMANELEIKEFGEPGNEMTNLGVIDNNGNMYIVNLKHEEMKNASAGKKRKKMIKGMENIFDPIDKENLGKDEDLLKDTIDELDKELKSGAEKIHEKDKMEEAKEIKQMKEEIDKDPDNNAVTLQEMRDFMEAIAKIAKETERRADEQKKKAGVIDIVEINEEDLTEGKKEEDETDKEDYKDIDRVTLELSQEEKESILKEVDIFELFDEIDRKMMQEKMEKEKASRGEDIAEQKKGKEESKADEDVPKFDVMDEIDRLLAESLEETNKKAIKTEEGETTEAKTEEATAIEEAKMENALEEIADNLKKDEDNKADQQTIDDVRKDLADVLTDQSDGKTEGEILAQMLLDELEGKKTGEGETVTEAEKTPEQIENEKLIDEQVAKDLEKTEWQFTKEKLKKDFLRRLWKEVRTYLSKDEIKRIQDIVRDSISDEGNEFINDLSKQEILHIVKEAFKKHLKEKYTKELEKDPVQRLKDKKKELDNSKKKEDKAKKIEHVAKRSMYRTFIDYFTISMITEAVSKKYDIDKSYINFINSETAIAMGYSSHMFVNSVAENAEGLGKLMLNIVLDSNSGYDDVMAKVPHEVWHIFKMNVIDKPGNEKLAEEYNRVYEEITSKYESARELHERSKAHYLRRVWSNLVAEAKATGDFEAYTKLSGFELSNKYNYKEHKEVYKQFEEYLKEQENDVYNDVLS